MVVQEQVHTGTTFISYIETNALTNSNEEHVSFHLENKWETTRSVQQKKTCLGIESTDEFDRNHEEGFSLIMEFDGGQSFNNPNFLECSSLGRSLEIEFIRYLSIEEENLAKYELDDFQHKNDEDLFEDQILKNLEEIITEVIIGRPHHEMILMSGS